MAKKHRPHRRRPGLLLGRRARRLLSGRPRKQKRSDKETVKLAAARAVLEHGARLREAVDLEERLQALERRLKGRKA